MGVRIFTINPGSTSTKVALYDGDVQVFTKALRHSAEDIDRFPTTASQLEFRCEVILKAANDSSIDMETVDAFAGRGGLLRPLEGGTYKVNEKMLDDLNSSRYGDHASNLGAVIAHRFGSAYNKQAYVVNPVVVDELMDEARYTGIKDIPRKSIFHALNQKAVAERMALEIGTSYEKANLIVAHLGGGFSVGAHHHGKVIDVSNALEEGAFSPERAGTLPTVQLVDLCFSGNYSKRGVMNLLVGKGGLFSYTGTKDFQEIILQSKSDREVKKLLNAFIYRISKEICSMSASLKGEVDCIIITGGIAHDDFVTKAIEKYVSFIAPVRVYPGEDELKALAEGVISVINGTKKAVDY